MKPSRVRFSEQVRALDSSCFDSDRALVTIAPFFRQHAGSSHVGLSPHQDLEFAWHLPKPLLLPS